MAIDILTSRLFNTLTLREFLESLESLPYGRGEPAEFKLKQPSVSAVMRELFNDMTLDQRNTITGYIDTMHTCARQALSFFQKGFLAHINHKEEASESHLLDAQLPLQNLDAAYEMASVFFQGVIGPMLGRIDPDYDYNPNKINILLYEMDQLDYDEGEIDAPG